MLLACRERVPLRIGEVISLMRAVAHRHVALCLLSSLLRFLDVLRRLCHVIGRLRRRVLGAGRFGKQWRIGLTGLGAIEQIEKIACRIGRRRARAKRRGRLSRGRRRAWLGFLWFLAASHKSGQEASGISGGRGRLMDLGRELSLERGRMVHVGARAWEALLALHLVMAMQVVLLLLRRVLLHLLLAVLRRLPRLLGQLVMRLGLRLRSRLGLLLRR